MDASQTQFLNSWKEIANYLNRGVRTVQRWEKMGLPVRRVHSGPRAPVIAAIEDLDRWIRSAQSHGFANPQNPQHLLLRGELLKTIQEARSLRTQTATLRHHGQAALQRLIGSIETLEKNCAAHAGDGAIAPKADSLLPPAQITMVPPPGLLPIRIYSSKKQQGRV